MTSESDMSAQQQQFPECYPICDEYGIYRAKSGMNYSFLYFYERKFFNFEFINTTKHWGESYWPVSFLHAFVYLVCIFAGQRFMRFREKCDLRRGLIAWNMLLCAFSIMGCVRLWPEFIHVLSNRDMHHSYCIREFVPGNSSLMIHFRYLFYFIISD
jgi:hypothetical protein